MFVCLCVCVGGWVGAGVQDVFERLCVYVSMRACVCACV